MAALLPGSLAPPELGLEAFGARITIRAPARELLDEVRTRLPAWARPASVRRADLVYALEHDCEHLLFRGGNRIASARELDPLLEFLDMDLHRQVALAARSAIFVHAGVVGRNGRAIVIPGRSMSGKSSLVAALVERGATYYSDEHAAIGGDAHVHPYSTTLSMRHPTLGALRVPVTAIGGRPATEPIPVGLIVVTRYEPGSAWDPQPLTPGKSVFALIANTLLARDRTAQMLRSMQAVSRRAAAVTSLRGEAGDIADDLLRRLEEVRA